MKKKWKSGCGVTGQAGNLRKSNFTKKKIFFTIFLIFTVLIFVGVWNIISKGYDKQNTVILFLKEIIPNKISRPIRDTIFIIPDLKERNKLLKQQLEKYEQGLEGRLFVEKTIKSKNNKEYLLKEFYLPFLRLDNRLGWQAEEYSLRAHYLEIVDDKVVAISGSGKTIFFKKKNIFNKSLKQQEISNNIKEILNQNSSKLIGIRDLFIDNDQVYISMQHKDSNGFTINIYRANLNFEKLNFELFFKTNEYWPKYNVFSGGRIENFKNNKILFSIGFAKNYDAPQDKKSLLGKIISIDKKSKKYDLISYGHRNPQGLYYSKYLDLIINTEHGPKGGDEVNFNFLKNNQISNFGWPIASYGAPYPGEKHIFEKRGWFRDSHYENGFIEPIKYFTPSIGISEIMVLPGDLDFNGKKRLFVSSLRAASLYVIQLNDKLDKILNEDRIYIPEHRIRDIDYDKENDVFFLLFEFTPSVGVLKSK